MADSFIQRVARKLGFDKPKDDGSPRVGVTVFGKHPGWDDHIPELRTGDARLVEFRRMLYDAITGNVDSGQWDKLQKENQLQPWGHALLLTGGGGDRVAARAWYSRDGKGRDRYPMVGAVRCGNLPLAWTAREAFPALQSLQTQCESAASADAVRAAVGAAEEQLLARATPGAGPPEFPPEAAARHAGGATRVPSGGCGGLPERPQAGAPAGLAAVPASNGRGRLRAHDDSQCK